MCLPLFWYIILVEPFLLQLLDQCSHRHFFHTIPVLLDLQLVLCEVVHVVITPKVVQWVEGFII